MELSSQEEVLSRSIRRAKATVDNIKVKLATWKGTLLSIMGRVQLVCRVAWNSDCAPFDVVGLSTKSAKQLNSALIFHLAGKSSTGLSTKSAKQLNSALIFHLARNFTSCIENWVVFCRARFMRGGNLDHYIQSSIRPGIKGFLSDITIYFRSLIGTGALVSFWNDNWLGYSLVETLHILMSITFLQL
ncbi:unnamed protein product [Trifolium pratense]|uniref:Uncharacterized protein n=1 Tax=Trifolium pratense TaxID=57577 RepID=A0ACB0JGA5_TRIPR|nr:unnamed protein product [Trifolium pratense]